MNKVKDPIKEIDWEGSSSQGIYLNNENEGCEDRSVIVFNAVGCRECKTVAISRSVHDYSSCKCGAVAADGGRNYIRRTGEFSNSIDLSIITGPESHDYIKMVAKSLPE